MDRWRAGRIAIVGWAGAALIGPGAGAARGQVSLADDIIAAATANRESGKQKTRTALGRSIGGAASPYRRTPGSTDVSLGQTPGRQLAPLARTTRRPADPAARIVPTPDRPAVEHGLAPSVEPLPPPVPGDDPDGPIDFDDDPGPPEGFDLDAAIDRLVACNRDLQTKFFEIPQAEADILTAGLRENPLLFYSSGTVPYGSYSSRRPGDVDHGLSLVYPVDYSGKRKARVALARREKCVLTAQYRDAVRLEIDNLYTAFVDVLAARQAARAAERGLGRIGDLAEQARRRPAPGPAGEEAADDLIIERDLAALSVDDERARFAKARRRLATLLDLPPGEVEGFQVRGALRVIGPEPPPLDDLIGLALAQRADLDALRRGVERAEAEHASERAERFSDAYLLYTPFDYRDNSQAGQLSATTWGAGLFVSAPLFNRNQGNIRRAGLNVAQTRNEVLALERRVIAEVTQAALDLANTRDDVARLERATLPAVRRKRQRAAGRLKAGEIDPAGYLAIQRDSTALVRYHRETLARHRRNALRLNTAVGRRIMP